MKGDRSSAMEKIDNASESWGPLMARLQVVDQFLRSPESPGERTENFWNRPLHHQCMQRRLAGPIDMFTRP